MSWRTVVITKICKLDYKMGYMVVRSEDTNRILLDEISVLLIENTAVSITGCLLSELTERMKINVSTGNSEKCLSKTGLSCCRNLYTAEWH